MTVDMAAEVEKARGLAPKPPAHESRRRLDQVRTLLLEVGVDCLLVASTSGLDPEPIRYLAGYESTLPGSRRLLFVPVDDPPVLLIEHPWRRMAAESMTWIDDVRTFAPASVYGGDTAPVDDIMEDAGIDRVGVIGDEQRVHRTVFDAAFPEVRFVDGSSIWLGLATSLSPHDRAMIEQAGRIAERGLAAAIAACAPGVPERVVWHDAMRELASSGAEFLLGRSISTHVSIGAYSAGTSNLCPFLFTEAELQEGQQFWIDVIVCHRGYYFDCNRTVAIGEPTREQRRLHEVTRDMYDSMCGALRPGLTGRELWMIGQEIAADAGYGEYVNAPFLGHGTGISLSHGPLVRPDESRPVQPGTYLNLEPGLFVPEVGSACIENTLYVTEDRQEPVNQASHDLFVV